MKKLYIIITSLMLPLTAAISSAAGNFSVKVEAQNECGKIRKINCGNLAISIYNTAIQDTMEKNSAN